MSPAWEKWTTEAGWPATTARLWSPEAPKELLKLTSAPGRGRFEAGLEGFLVDGFGGRVADHVELAAARRARARVAAAAAAGHRQGDQREQGGHEAQIRSSSCPCQGSSSNPFPSFLMKLIKNEGGHLSRKSISKVRNCCLEHPSRRSCRAGLRRARALARGPGVREAARSSTAPGSSPLTRSARVTCSRTARRLARTAIQTSCRCSALPLYSMSSGGEDCTWAIGPSTARTTSAIVTSSARLGQPVTALGAAAGADDAVVLQLEQDVLEELQRNVLRLGQPLALDGLVAGGGQLGRGAHGVVGLRGNTHRLVNQGLGARVNRPIRGQASLLRVRGGGAGCGARRGSRPARGPRRRRRSARRSGRPSGS